MDSLSCSSGRERSGSAYFVDGVYDDGCIFPPEAQGNFSVLLAIDER